MQTIAELLAQELGASPVHVAERHRPAGSRATPSPSSPATARSCHGSMDDTDPAHAGRPADLSAQSGQAPAGGARPPSTEQGKLTRGAGRRHRQRPRRWRRWRTSTAPISRSAAPVPPWPVKRDWSRWRSCCWRSGRDCPDPLQAAQGFIDPEKGVETAADALAGRQRHRGRAACRTTPPSARRLRELCCTVRALAAESGRQGRRTRVYRLYYDFEQPLAQAGRATGSWPSTAARREGFLKVTRAAGPRRQALTAAAPGAW